MTTQYKKHAALLSAITLAVGLILPSQLQSAQITWTGLGDGSSTSDWQNATNWSGAIPVNSTNTALFTDTGTYNSTTAATIDANGSFTLGELQFTTTTSGTTPPITVNNSQNGIITLTGATGVLVQTKQTNPVTLNTSLALANAAAGNQTIFNITQATTVNGAISGSGNLLKIGSATLAFKGTNTYTGTTTIQQNNLLIGANAPAGSPGALGNATTPVQIGNSSTGATQNAGLVTTGKFTVGRDISVYPVLSTSVITIGGTQVGTSTFSGQTTLGAPANFESSTTGTSVVDFTGQITGGGAFSKTNAGALQLSNANNNYTGATTVKAGTLLINGANTGGGAYAISAGTLGGNGSIVTGSGANGLSLTNGATLAPGLIAGGTANSGTTFSINGDAALDGTLAIQADTATSKLAVSGALTLNPDSTLNFTGTSALDGVSSYVLGSYGSLSGTFGSITNEPTGYTLDYAYGGNQIALVSNSATPEPASVGILGTAAVGLLLSRRRRQRA